MRRAFAPLLPLSVLAIACASAPAVIAPVPDAAVDAPAVAPGDVPADADPAVTRGAAVYRRFCALCHGARGAGSGDGPDLRAEVPRHTDDEIRTIVRDGGFMMPAAPLDDGQRADVFTFLRATFGAYHEP
jgi:mono/diheme cytochrome c family protein